MNIKEETYNFIKIEKFAQNYWNKNQTFKVKKNTKKEKFYCLTMLPYPSGKLHMGHVRNYTIGDVIARYHRMLGKNVLHPMGWDSFGLPAENAAIENNIDPSEWTKKNIQYMKTQLISLGFSYDWTREINTSTPEYYRWEQWLFIKLYKKNLVYKKKSSVNWCPVDQTVLANEQVIENKCWRCNSEIIKKKISQWFIKITDYAEQLLNDLSLLDEWPKDVKKMQKNWIGREEIIEIKISLLNQKKIISVYTKRLDTLMGATYIAISIDHKISKKLAKNNVFIKKFINSFKNKDHDFDKNIFNIQGIKTDILAIHPLKKKLIPIWITNFIPMNEKINAFICSPAHNVIEWKFAKKYNIPIFQVILDKSQKETDTVISTLPILTDGKIFNSNQFNGLESKTANKIIFKELQNQNIVNKKIIFKLKDWGISRQRYWGTPIPMFKRKNGEISSIPEHKLPVLLSKIKIQKNHNKLFKNSIINRAIKKTFIDGEEVVLENDTFDTFMESSWYYARYTSPNFQKGIIDPIEADYWLPVDQYIGGIEHATMHLIYFRFYHKILRDFGLVTSDEPVKNLLCQGMVLSDAFYYYKKDGTKTWVPSQSVIVQKDNFGNIVQAQLSNGIQVNYAGKIKMSKSKKNGIDPEFLIKKYGADTIRLFIIFSAPIESSLEWSESGVIGSFRFLKKLWKLVSEYTIHEKKYVLNTDNPLNEIQKKIVNKINWTISKVTNDIEYRKTFNTAIASIMKLVNEISKFSIITYQDNKIMYNALITIIKIMYPFTPHICFNLWYKLTGTCSIDTTLWPIENTLKLEEKENNQTIILQINGKIKQKIQIDINKKISQEIILNIAKSSKKIQKYIKNKKIKKIIYVKNKILNIVI